MKRRWLVPAIAALAAAALSPTGASGGRLHYATPERCIRSFPCPRAGAVLEIPLHAAGVAPPAALFFSRDCTPRGRSLKSAVA